MSEHSDNIGEANGPQPGDGAYGGNRGCHDRDCDREDRRVSSVVLSPEKKFTGWEQYELKVS